MTTENKAKPAPAQTETAPKPDEPPTWFKAYAEETKKALGSLDGKVNGFKGYVDQALKLRGTPAAEGQPRPEAPFQDDYGDNEQLRALAADVAALKDAPLVPKRQSLAAAFGGSPDDYKGLNGDRMDAMLAKVTTAGQTGTQTGATVTGDKPKPQPTAVLDGNLGTSSLNGEGANLLSENWLRKQAEKDNQDAATRR